MGLTQEEKEVLVKILADVRINPLDSNAAPLLQIIQSIGRKAFATEQSDSFEYPAEESQRTSRAIPVDTQKVRRMLEIDEGLKLKPYKCTAGKTTIGIGRNLDDVGISKELAYQMLDEDVAMAQKVCSRLFEEQWTKWSENRKLGWINLAFNLGYERLSKFKNTLRAARIEDWDAVESGLRDSLWYKQVGKRAERVVEMICGEGFPYVKP